MNKELLESKVKSLTSSLEVFKENLVVEGSFVPPFIGKDEIKLVVIGQDPTVRNPKSRKSVTCTLNLNKQNSALYRYIKRLCDGLGITMENVYATNLFKYFYSIPPANTPEVLITSPAKSGIAERRVVKHLPFDRLPRYNSWRTCTEAAVESECAK